jgi:hypothetical protein
VVFKSGGIEKGLTHVTIRNNNTFPVRNVSVQIHFLSKSSGGVQHPLKWTVSDLILPATDYEIEAIEAANPQIFVSHGSGSADEWIPWAEILNADRAEYHPQLLNSAVIIEGKTKVEFSTTAPPDWQIVIGLTTRIPKGH